MSLNCPIQDVPPTKNAHGTPSLTAECVRSNLQAVRDRMALAAARSGSNPVQLVAITKSCDVKAIRVLINEGVLDLGENRIQVAQPKITTLKDDVERHGIRWHFIGHLQTNKVKYVVRHFHSIDSVDSERLLNMIAKETRKQNKTSTPCLVEVNVSGEKRKHGLEPEELRTFLKRNAIEKACEITGLMTMAPYTELPNVTSRPVFAGLRKLLEEANAGSWYRTPLKELSMGMSQDYEIAIEEGATMVRVGSGLFKNPT